MKLLIFLSAAPFVKDSKAFNMLLLPCFDGNLKSGSFVANSILSMGLNIVFVC